MVVEVIPFNFEIDKLQDHFHRFVLPLAPTLTTNNYGGWAVLSSTGSYTDGWIASNITVDASNISDSKESMKGWFKKIGIKPTREYFRKTEICTGYLEYVIDQISEWGFTPCRARIIRLLPNATTIWHRDAPPSQPSVRLHVPIATNQNCFFEHKDEKAHMPADGSGYLVQVNRVHRATNFGNTDRYHLAMDVLDTKGVSKHEFFSKKDVAEVAEQL